MTGTGRTPEFTLAAIVRDNGKKYQQKYRKTAGQKKVLSAVKNCRTAALGGHKDICDSCGEIRISYNSCRNRHCPQCQFLPKEKWIAKRSADLLPIQYFHVVFTIPDTLYGLFYSNQKVCYDLFFKAVKETLLTIAADKKHLGAKTGFLAVMHTWGQNLLFHPHVHCIVTGGGLTKEGEWISCRKNFFLPVTVLSVLFKRFLLHVLPTRFHKIRAYGLLSNHSRKNLLPLCRRLLNAPEPEPLTDESWKESLARICGIDLEYCSNCNQKSMRFAATIMPLRERARSP